MEKEMETTIQGLGLRFFYVTKALSSHPKGLEPSVSGSRIFWKGLFRD